MLDGLVGIVAIVVLFVLLHRQQGRLAVLEREIGALRGALLARAPAAVPDAASAAVRRAVPIVAGAVPAPAGPEPAAEESEPLQGAAATPAPEAAPETDGPW